MKCFSLCIEYFSDEMQLFCEASKTLLAPFWSLGSCLQCWLSGLSHRTVNEEIKVISFYHTLFVGGFFHFHFLHLQKLAKCFIKFIVRQLHCFCSKCHGDVIFVSYLGQRHKCKKKRQNKASPLLLFFLQAFLSLQIWILPEKSRTGVTTVLMDSIILKPGWLLTTNSDF